MYSTYIYIYIVCVCLSLSLYVYTYVYIYIYIYIYIGEPHLVELSGLRVRPFKVSGGSPRPPPEQTPVVKVKTPRVSNNKIIRNK